MPPYLLGFLQFAIQTIMSLAFLYWWIDEKKDESVDDTIMQQAFTTMTVMCVLVSVPVTLTYTAIICFHLYLYHVDMGTYEWMLARRKRARDQRQVTSRTVELASTDKLSDTIASL